MEVKKETGVKNATVIKKTKYRNFPMVPRVVFGRGSFDQLGEILMPHRKSSDAPMLFLMDDVFANKSLACRIPKIFNDQVIFISAREEPKNGTGRCTGGSDPQWLFRVTLRGYWYWGGDPVGFGKGGGFDANQ